MLNCMVAIKGLNKTHPQILRALEVHVQNYPGNDASDHFSEFRTAVLAAQDSDLANLNADLPSVGCRVLELPEDLFFLDGRESFEQ